MSSDSELWMNVFGGFVTKTFETQKQAERFQNKLYEKYSTVRLTGFPHNGESGRYEWYVCE